MPLLKKVSVLAAKIETAVGTAITVLAADATVNVFDAEITPDIEFITRESQGTFSKQQSTTGLRSGRATFKTELTGDGAVGIPTWASLFLPACGWVATAQVYKPVSAAPGSSVKTLTIAKYENGNRRAIRGAVGTFNIVMETGKPVMIEWDFIGAWVPPTAAVILTPTYNTIMPMRFANVTMTLGSWAPCVQSISLDAGNETVMRECQSDSTSAGYLAGIITNRNVTGSVNPEAELVSTEDYHAKWLTHTEAALSIAITDGTDTITFAAPQYQYSGISPAERNGIQTADITFQCNKSAAAGDDELSITFA